MQKNVKKLMLIFALCNTSFAETFQYKDEFNKWWNTSVNHKDNYHPAMKNLRNEVENCIKQSDNNLRPWYDLKKYKNFFSRELCSGSIQTVDSELPKLHKFVENLCKKNNISKPLIVIPPFENVINAGACKLFRENGVIFIFPGLINNTNDEELEAIIAHEIGHIKLNHVNKNLAIAIPTFICSTVAFSKLISCYLKDFMPKISTEKLEKIQIIECSIALSIMTCAIIKKIIIGKKFEEQADKFSMDHGHANGIKSYMTKNDYKYSFSDTLKYIEDNKEFLSRKDYEKFMRLWKQAESINNSAEYWDEHPTHAERVKSAEEYLNNQKLQEEPVAA